MENPIDLPRERDRPRVLVADDEHVIANTLAVILNQSGFEAVAVYNGAEAVEKARTWEPDLQVSDMVMPQMSGIEAAIRICAMIPACQVLLFSGQAGTADLLSDARIAGHSFEILSKPLHPHELLARLHRFPIANVQAVKEGFRKERVALRMHSGGPDAGTACEAGRRT